MRNLEKISLSEFKELSNSELRQVRGGYVDDPHYYSCRANVEADCKVGTDCEVNYGTRGKCGWEMNPGSCSCIKI